MQLSQNRISEFNQFQSIGLKWNSLLKITYSICIKIYMNNYITSKSYNNWFKESMNVFMFEKNEKLLLLVYFLVSAYFNCLVL